MHKAHGKYKLIVQWVLSYDPSCKILVAQRHGKFKF